VRDGLYAEARCSGSDFENQIVPASVAGAQAPHSTSAGQTLQQGSKSPATPRAPALVDWPVDVFGRLSWTWLWTAEFVGERYSTIPGFTSVKVTGNRLPYTPGAAARGHARRACAVRARVEVEGVYTSSAFTDDLNTVEITPNGQRARCRATQCGT